jgi:hypothetical protein
MWEKADTDEYKGYLTYLFEDLGLGVSRYTPVMRRLVAMGCVRQVAVGGRGNMSRWKLIKPPTELLYAETTSRRHRSRLAELEERVALLEEWYRQCQDSPMASVAS